MSSDERVYFVRGDDGSEYGPAGFGELRDWIQENRLGLESGVRLDEHEGPWKKLQDFPELIALMAESRAGVIRGDLEIAPLLPRLLAGIADLILAFMLCCPIFAVAFFCQPNELLMQWMQYAANPVGPPPTPPLWFQDEMQAMMQLVVALYFAGFHAAHGRTPAKSILRLGVVDAAGRKPSFFKSLLRGLALSISVFYLFGFPLTYAFINPQRRTFHDFVAGTYVVKK